MVQLLLSGLANGCIYGLIAVGFVLIYKATEAVNFAQGDMMMLGAFAMIGLSDASWLGLPFWAAVPAAVLVMGALGAAIQMLFVRPLLGESQIAVVMLTIALGFLFRFAAGTIFGYEPQTLDTPFAGRDLAVGGAALALADALVLVVTVVLTGLLFVFFARTKLGVAMQAASQNQLAAAYMGIPVQRIQTLVWALAGAIAAVAGILFAAKGTIDPQAGLLGIKAFAAAVVGGMGSLPGALLGGLLIGVAEPFAARYGPTGYAQLTPYLLLFVVLVLRPHGLVAQVRAKKV